MDLKLDDPNLHMEIKNRRVALGLSIEDFAGLIGRKIIAAERYELPPKEGSIFDRYLSYRPTKATLDNMNAIFADLELKKARLNSTSATNDDKFIKTVWQEVKPWPEDSYLKY